MYTVFGERRRSAPVPIRPKKRTKVVKPGHITRKEMTPNQIATYQLGRALSSIPNVTKDLKMELQGEFEHFDQLRFMHMPTLAAALVFIHYIGDEITPENFTDKNLEPVVINILPNANLSEKDYKLAYIKMKESLLRYIRAVLFYREAERDALQTRIESSQTAEAAQIAADTQAIEEAIESRENVELQEQESKSEA